MIKRERKKNAGRGGEGGEDMCYGTRGVMMGVGFVDSFSARDGYVSTRRETHVSRC